MKKLLFTLSVTFFVSHFLFSQTVNLSWGPEKKMEKRVEDKGFVGQLENFFYTSSIDHKIVKLSITEIKEILCRQTDQEISRFQLSKKLKELGFKNIDY